MAGLGVYKLDNGESFPVNGFPIRSFLPHSKEGAGQWLLTQRSDVAGPSVGSESGQIVHKKPKTANVTLNRQLLMVIHCVDKPSDLCSVDISEKKLNSVELDGLEEFDSVAYINASDNNLTLEPFRKFPALRELELSLNGICALEIHPEDFLRLEVLDLSYNNLSADAILAVGLLAHLKVLHLTGNNLQMLPPNMAGPYSLPSEIPSQPSSLFQNLEVLMLDDNKLSSPEVFSSLANLKRLQHLNLQGNYISEVPYLEEMMPNFSALETEGSTEDSTVTKCFSDPQVMDQPEWVSQVTDEDKEAKLYSKEFCPPFQQLRYLNLASNEIAEEEALLAVALFPLLSELIIHSNPLTTQRSGDPPLLTGFLQEKLGIKIRRRTTADTVKPHIILPVKSKRKVKTKIPKIPKAPWIPVALCISGSLRIDRGNKNNNPQPSECRSTDFLLPCFSQTSSEEREDDAAVASTSEPLEDAGIHSDFQQTEEPFFVTEVNDLLEPEYQEETQSTEEITQSLGKGTKNCPKKLIGYEALLDDNHDCDLSEALGIQHNVKVLEHLLKNLLIYRDSKANLDHLQRPYKEHQKRIKSLPPVSWKPKGEKVKEVLAEMKERKIISEVPLDKVIKSKDIYKTEYQEALSLLKDMKKKYKMVHLKAMEQAAQIESTMH